MTEAAHTRSAVKLVEVSKSFDVDTHVLQQISFTQKQGEFVSVLGPSGCGKSTLLKLVAGLLQPDTGELTVLEKKGAPPQEHLGFVFQDATLLPWLTVRKNIEMAMKIRHFPAEERIARGEQMLKLVGLGKVANFYPRQLSGGMKMRVSIARALALQPQLMLLDEPFGALDEMTRNRLNEELLALKARQHWSALFVTHSVAEATFLSDRIFIMSSHPGKIAHEIAVNFDHPRDASLREEPVFHQKFAEVLHTLRSIET